VRLLVVAGIVFLLLTLGTVNAADVCESELKGGDACSSGSVLGASVAGFSVSSEGTTRRFTGYTGTGSSCIYGPGSHTVNLLVSDINVSAIESATLTIMAYDCDNPTSGCDGRPEIDTVYFNGEYTGILTGATDQWSTVSFDVDPSKILNGSNVVKVYIDTSSTGCWCLGVDSA